MKRQDMLRMVKAAFPIQITRGEEYLDAALFELSRRFILCMDRNYPMPKDDDYPEEPWFLIMLPMAEKILGGRSGKLYFTENSFPFLRGSK